MTTITLNYQPRDHFVDFHQRSNRWALMVVHRRGGKTVACVADLILKALYTKKPNARFAYIAPFRQQAKEIAWQYLKDLTENIREGPPRESELRIKMPNGAWITLYGADNPDALRGIYLDGCILDEFGDMRPSLMGEVILPTLADRAGWLAVIGTPKGRNQFYELRQRAEAEDAWYFKILRASESNVLKASDLEEFQGQMSEEQYEQEFECSFDAAVTGTYYAHLINEAEKRGRISTDRDLFDPEQKVNVVADIGYSDTCAFWFWQTHVDGFALVDYYESSGQPLGHYLDMLKLKEYNYQHLWLPHDAKAKTLQTGKSTIEQLMRPWLISDKWAVDEKLKIRIVPKLAVQHGIEAVRMVLPQCYFDKRKTFVGIEAIRSYRRKWNETTQTFSNTPLHDWASNGADGFRYFALVCRKSKGQSAEVHMNRAGRGDRSKKTGYTLDQLYEDRNQVLSAGRRRI